MPVSNIENLLHCLPVASQAPHNRRVDSGQPVRQGKRAVRPVQFRAELRIHPESLLQSNVASLHLIISGANSRAG